MTKPLPVILLLLLISVYAQGQVLSNLLDNSKHAAIAGTYKENSIKKTWYTLHMPFLLNMTVYPDKRKPVSEWTTDTITYSKSYLKNGFIENEKETLPNGDTCYLKEYYFDSDGGLIKTREINNKRIRYYDYQETNYRYMNGQLSSIDKMRYKNADTSTTTTLFLYSANNLDKVIETDNHTGDTLLFSRFTYTIKENYIEEESFLKDFCEVRTTYYYTLGSNGRIVKVSNGMDGYKKSLKSATKISYDYSKEIPLADRSFVKVEKYNL